MPKIKIVKTISALRRVLAKVRQSGQSVGVVPTMGALHQGHMSLVKASARKTDFTVVTIFVNPLQFGKNEDLDKYPRRLIEDADLCAEAGASLIFAPDASSMYAKEHQTYVLNPALENLYCGKYRPEHFRGVLTVVAKLFLAVEPQWAFFGKKDYQQAYLIRRMVDDLNWNMKIGLVATQREPSGLARSSRNEYLSPDERQRSVAIHEGLLKALHLYQSGERKVAKILAPLQKGIAQSGGELQYAELVSQKTLLPFEGIVREPAVLLVAAFFGKTRLIDNIELN